LLPDQVNELARGLDGIGLALRGAFHPVPADRVPAFADGAPTLTVLLLGWTGGDQWPMFAASLEAADGDPNPLDRWSRRLIDRIAAEIAGVAFYPFGGPPWFDFQSWALKAEPVYRSPLGLLIHPKWGLWHSYRGAIGLRQRWELMPRADSPAPCERCLDRRCLTACPVSAFKADRSYDYAACRQYVEGDGQDCRTYACAARRACPVAPDKRYSEAQAAFHMNAFLGNRLG
jgi:hypothetical protein